MTVRRGATTGRDGFAPISTRDRNGRPVRGLATGRPDTDVRTLYFPFVSPWGRWTPWYSSGFGYGGYGYFAYDPFFSPYYRSYYPYNLYGRATSPSVYEDEDYEMGGEAYGAIRVKANIDEARVYIDGALVGIVDDFNGLRNHLELAVGVHQIELRAEGYENYVGSITVEAGTTRTERLSLKKR